MLDPRSQVVPFGHRLASMEIPLKHSGQSANQAPSASGVARAMSMFIGLTIRKLTTRAMIRLKPSTRSLMPVPSPEPAELASGNPAGTLTSCHEGARRGTPKNVVLG
jgi:hypothetical protein